MSQSLESPAGRRRTRAWWADSLVLMACVLLAELALDEAVDTSTLLISQTARAWVDALALCLIIGPLFGWTLYRRHVDAKYAHVPDPAKRAPGSPHQKVRLVLTGALSIVGMVIIGALWAHLASLGAARTTAAWEELASQQRVSSQRIARLAVTLTTDPQAVVALTDVLERLEGENVAMAAFGHDTTGPADANTDSGGGRSASVAILPPATVRAWQQASQQLAAHTRAMLTTQAPVERVLDAADQMLLVTDDVRNQLAVQQQERIGNQTRWAWSVALLMLACLLGTLGLVLEPVIRLLRRQHVAIVSQSLEYERLAMVAQRTSNAVLITDADMRITWANEAFTRLSGYTLDEVMGLVPGDFLRGEESDPEVVRHLLRAVDRGEPSRGTLQDRRKDGTLHWVDLSIEPLRSGGQVSGFVCVYSDISDLVSTQQALTREREALANTTAQLKEALAVARLGSWSLDLATNHVDWSPETYVLFGRDPQLGPPPREQVAQLYAPEDSARLREAAVAAYTEGRAYSLVVRTAGHNPDVRWIRAEGRARYAPDGSIVGLIGTAVDVTESIEREEALRLAQAHAEAANRSKSEFLANMSHEIRTPLTAILGYTDLLRDDVRESGADCEQLAALDTIRRAGEHLLSVINDILDISKIEAGRMAVEAVPVELPAVLLDVESLMRARAEQKGVSLECRLTAPIPVQVHSDPTRLRQVLMNLVGNAVKFTDRGRVLLEAGVEQSDAGPLLVLSVDDTGPGMTEDQVAQLFQAFTQVDSSMTRRHGGTGLGLTISRRLAQLMGGEVELAQTAVGRGSRFEVRLPLRVVDDSPHITQITARRLTPAAVPATVTLRGHILLAEDGEDNQRLIAILLRAAGAEVTIVRNGREALEALDWARAAGAPFDVLLTDMQMPEMDGYTLARTLRSAGDRIPVIALTAHAMAEDRQRCIDAGCDDYASKPIDRTALLATLARWLPDSPEVFPPIAGSASTDDMAVAAGASDRLVSELADDPDLAGVVRVFALALPDRAAALAAAVRAVDDVEVLRLAHQLKGAAGSYGFPLVSTLARTLEVHTRAADREAQLMVVERLLQLASAAQRSVETSESVAVRA
ncbi:MAG: response regulator [Gemmatimonadaceae bacterium]|nr:response regulator [Gemmatimonadaceae bacterium]